MKLVDTWGGWNELERNERNPVEDMYLEELFEH